jgi:hypothetical protein
MTSSKVLSPPMLIDSALAARRCGKSGRNGAISTLPLRTVARNASSSAALVREPVASRNLKSGISAAAPMAAPCSSRPTLPPPWLTRI